MSTFFEFLKEMIKDYQPLFAALIASGIAYLGYVITKFSVEKNSHANLERMQKEHEQAIALLTAQIDDAHEISKNNFGKSLQADADRACNDIIEVFNEMCENFPPLIRDLANGLADFSKGCDERKMQLDVAKIIFHLDASIFSTKMLVRIKKVNIFVPSEIFKSCETLISDFFRDIHNLINHNNEPNFWVTQFHEKSQVLMTDLGEIMKNSICEIHTKYKKEMDGLRKRLEK